MNTKTAAFAGERSPVDLPHFLASSGGAAQVSQALAVTGSARCADAEDPDAWFPEWGESAALENLARRLCAGCPVATQCLDLAVARGEEHGIWGGLAPHEVQAHRFEVAAAALLSSLGITWAGEAA